MARPRAMAGDYVGVLAGRVLAAVLQAVTYVVLARAAGPADFGLVVATVGATTAASAVFGFGFGPYLTRVRSLDPGSGEVGDLVRQNNRTSVVLGLVALLVLSALGLVDPRFWALAPLAFALVAQRNSAVWQGIAVADERTRLFGATLTLRRLVLLAGTLVAIALGVDVLLGFATAQLLSESSVNAFLRRRLRGTVPAPVGLGLVVLARRAAPFWVETVAGQLRNLDVLVVTLVAGAPGGGLFAAASRTSSALNIVPSTLATVLMPRVSRYGRRAARATRLAVALGSGFMAVVLGAVVALAPWGVPLLLGDDFAGAVPVVQLYCAGLLLLSFTTMLNAVLQGSGRAALVARAALVGSVSILAGVGVGAAAGGAVGAAAGYVLAWLVQLAVLFAGVRRPPVGVAREEAR